MRIMRAGDPQDFDMVVFDMGFIVSKFLVCMGRNGHKAIKYKIDTGKKCSGYLCACCVPDKGKSMEMSV